MQLDSVTVPEWPRLAWLTMCPRSATAVTSFVGSGVETADNWFFEGVWAGSYADGGIDETDLVFGSGCRIRADRLVFVSAGSTLDALHSLRRPDGVMVSNSLPCLLAVAGGSLDLGFPHLHRAFASIRGGLENYQKELPTTVGPVGLTYFDNLVWDGETLIPLAKPDGDRDFSSYDNYRCFLDESIAALVANALAAERAHPLTLMSTLSRGYDSPAVTVLAREAGCREAFGFDQSPIGQPDNAESIAEVLGVHLHQLKISDAPEADVTFIAGGAGHGGSVTFKAAEPFLAGRVVFTGFHGDKVWDKNTQALGPDIVRGDTSGSDLSEYRLGVGFVNCAVPFLAVRQIKSIHAISNSPELAPWDVGGTYNRPICRRLVEECGVPREAFGIHKFGMFRPVPGPSSFLTPELRRDYFAWLRSRRWEWVRRRKIPPSPTTDALVTGRFGRAVNRLRRSGWVRKLGPRADRVLAELGPDAEPGKRRRIHQYVIHWAVESTKARYPVPASMCSGAEAEIERDGRPVGPGQNRGG